MQRMEDTPFGATASEMIAALRGRRSCAGLSRLAGYQSNIVQRWESGHCFPPTTTFLQLHQKLRPRAANWLARFFHRPPGWVAEVDPASREAVAAFVAHLKGKTTTVEWSERIGVNRFTLGRWLSGTTEPRLPDLLRVVDVSTRRLPDLVAAFIDPETVPSVRSRWHRLQLARKAGSLDPWSHAVLRALEIEDAPSDVHEQEAFIATKLGITRQHVQSALELLGASGQLRKTPRGYRPAEVTTIDTGRDARQSQAIQAAWLATALERFKEGREGRFGYSLFAVSREDFERLNALHIGYVRAMQEIIAASKQVDRVGLYCAQLLDLGQ